MEVTNPLHSPTWLTDLATLLSSSSSPMSVPSCEPWSLPSGHAPSLPPGQIFPWWWLISVTCADGQTDQAQLAICSSLAPAPSLWHRGTNLPEVGVTPTPLPGAKQQELGKGILLMNAWEGPERRMGQDGWRVNGWINTMKTRAERHLFCLRNVAVEWHSPETANIYGNG